MYENEEIDEKVGREFAKEVGAIFRYTSAKNASGVEDLFKAIGSKYIDPNYEEGSVQNASKAEEESDKGKKSNVRLSNTTNKTETTKKKCC